MKTVTLKAAIQDAISYMGYRSFSIEDVYKLVKSRFENGELSFIGVVTTDGAFPYKYNSFKNGVLAVIAQSNDYNVVYGPKYRTFNKKNSVQALPNAKTLVKDATKQATATNSPVVTATQTSAPVALRIYAYLKAKKGQFATVKAIQSALKQKGLTCADIHSIVRNMRDPNIKIKMDSTAKNDSTSQLMLG